MFGYRRRHNDALRGIEDDPQESMSFSRDGSSSSCSSLVRELEIKMSKSDRSIIVWQAQPPPILYYHGNQQRKGICTRSYGGSKQYIRQEFFRCKTCGHSEGLGVCVVCKDRCHRGHVLEAKGFTSSYCDCGTISSTSQGCSCFETWDQKFCTFAHKSSSHARQHAPATVSPLSPSSPSSQSSSSSSSSEMPLSASSRINQRDRPTASDPPGGKMPLRVGMRKTFLSVIHSSKTNEETPSPIIRKLLAEQEKKQAGEEEPTGRGAQQRAIDGTSITSKPQTAAATMATPRWKVAYEADTLIHRPLQRQHPSLSSSPWFESLRAGGSNDDGKTSPLPTTLNLGVASSSAAAAAGEEGGLRLTGSRVYQPFRHFRNGEGEGWRGGDGREANRSKGYSSLNGGEHDQKRRVVFMAPEARNQGRTSSPQYTDEKEVPNHSHANDMKQRRDDDDKTGATNTSAPPQPERVNSRCEAYDTLRADDYLDENVKLSLSSSAAEEERKYPPPLSLAPDFKGSGGRQSVPPPPPLNLPPPPQSLLQRQRGRRRVSAPITYMEEKRAQARAQRARRRNGTTDSSSTSSSSSSGGGSGDLEKVRRLLGRYGLCIGNTVERPAGDEGLGAMQGKWTVFVRASNKSCQPLKKYVSSVRFTFQGRSVSLSSRFHRNFAISRTTSSNTAKHLCAAAAAGAGAGGRFGSRKMNITVKIFFKSHLRIPPMRHVHRLGGFQNEAAAGKPLSSSAFSSPFNSNSVGGRTYEHKTTVYPDLKSEFTRVVSSSSSSSRGSSSHLTTKISPPIAAQSGSSPSPSPVFNKLSPEDISTLTQHLSERLQVASSGGGHRGQPRRMVRAYSDGMVVEERRGMKAERKNGKEKNKTNRFKWTIDLHGVKGAREEGEDEETGARDRKDWNRPFQTAIHQGGYSNLHQLFVDFVSMARMYARVIVREQEVRDSEKTVRPLDRVGGLAGGRKYLVNGILFKLCGDPDSSKAAAGCTGAPLRATSICRKGQKKNSKKTHSWRSGLSQTAAAFYVSGIFPPLRICVVHLIYQDKAAEGITMATKTAATAIPLAAAVIVAAAGNGALSCMVMTPMQGLCWTELLPREMHQEELHLAEHTVQGKRIFTAADVEFHLGKDGRLYALDLARAFPPECAWVASHLPRNGRQSEFFRIMRPELLAHIAKNGITPPLSPDVFTGFSRGSPLEEALRLERGAEEATRYLVSVIIPGLAARIEEGTTVRLSEPVSSVLHREGINCRHIGLLRAHLRRNLQRRTVRFFNLVVNSERFWQTKVYEGIIRRFGKVALQEARVPTDSKTHGDEAGGGGGAAADDDIAATTAAAEADDPRGQSDDKGRKGTFFLSKKRLRSRCRPLLVRIIVYLVESARIRPTAEALKDFKEAVGGGGGGRKAANEGGDESDGGSRSSRSKDGRPPFSDGNDGAHNSVVVDEKGREEVFVFHTVDFDESQAASVLDYALGKMLTIDARTQAAAAGRGSGLSLRRRHLSTNSASSSSSSPCPPPSISNPTTSGGGGGGSSKYYRNNIYEKEQQRMMARSGRMMRLANAAFKRVLRSSPLDDDARVCAAETLSQALEMEGKFDSADRILLLDTVPSLVSNSAKIKCLEHVADMFKHRLLSSPHLEATGDYDDAHQPQRLVREKEADANALDSFRRTPLHHIAANWGMLSVVGKRRRRKEAEEEEAAAAESHTDHDGGKEEEIGDDGLSDLSWLWQLSSPRTINAPDYQGNSALHLLVMSSSHLKAPPLRTAQALLEANADPFLRNMAGQNASLGYHRPPKKKEKRALNDAGVFSDAVEEAVQNRNDRALRFLMKSEARISPKSSESSSMAMTRGLVHAARYDNEELGEWLLTHNADPNRTDDIKGGLCPLEVAVSQQCFKMTATLLEARADASIEVSKARGGGTLLHLAMQMDESEDLYSIISPTTRIVGMLLTARVDPNRQNAAGQTPLHLAAAFQSNTCCFVGPSAFARHSGSLFVKRLVDAKASVSIEDRQGRRPIDCLGQRLDAAQTEQDGAHYDAQQRHVVAHGNKRKERSYVKRIRQLLSGADTSPRDTNKRPADDS
eukprot:jgi/Bigna1/66410/fgenesh1_pg.1_\